MATITNTKAVARAVHAGATVSIEEYTLTATAAADDIIKMIKIPHGATLIDAYVDIQGAAGNAGEVVIEDEDGTNYSASLSHSNGVIQRATKNVPATFSLTDAATDRFKWLSVAVGSNVSSAWTIGAKVRLVAIYSAFDRVGGGSAGGVA